MKKIGDRGGGRGKGGKNDQRFGLGRLLLVGLSITLALILLISTVGGRRFGLLHELALEIVGPVQQATSRLTSVFKTFSDDYFNLVLVRRENRVLREQLREYRQSLNRCGEARATNVRLRRLLDFKNAAEYPVLPAEIIGKDPSLWFRTVVINRGSSDGVTKGMPVETVEGIVGQVQAVTPNYARVLLAIAPSSAMDVMLQESRVRGILKGAASGVYTLEYVQKNAEVKVGDKVVTAGSGGLFPTGRAVGEVSRVEKKERGMFLEIEVKPAVDFHSLEELLIIKHERSNLDE